MAEQARVVCELSALHEGVHEEENRVLNPPDGGCSSHRGGSESETDEDGDSAATYGVGGWGQLGAITSHAAKDAGSERDAQTHRMRLAMLP